MSETENQGVGGWVVVGGGAGAVLTAVGWGAGAICGSVEPPKIAPDVVIRGDAGAEGIAIRALPGGGVEIWRCKSVNGAGVVLTGTAENPIRDLPLLADPFHAIGARK